MILHGRNACVTGSTSGIGLAIARAFAAQGANVMLNGLGDAAANEAARAALAAEFGTRILFDGADLSRGEGVRGLVRATQDGLGSLDVLVNNAGMQFVSPIEDFPDDRWAAIMALNLDAAFHAIKAAVPGMRTRGWGRIISTASAHSLVASPFKAAYVAAKHGLVGLTKAVALELAPHGVTCNAISPGYVWTPLVEAQIPDTMKARGMTQEQVIRDVLLAAQPTKQFVRPEDVAAAAVFLCSDAAAQMTGTNLTMDGGWTAA